MAQQDSPPLKFNNNNFVKIVELDNSLPLRDYNLSDTEFESYICANLAHEILPDNLTNTFPSPEDNSLTILTDASGPQLIGKTAFINNDSLINNELFAMKVKYTVLGGITADSTNIPIGDINPNTISLDPSSNTIFNSNLKIDISYNNDDQYTDSNPDNYGIWGVEGTRSTSAGIYNTFSAVNSVFNQDSGTSPFYIRENGNNIYSLGQNDAKWFTQEFYGLTVGNGKIAHHDIDNAYTLSSNNIISSVIDEADYSFNQFNKYQLFQDAPTIDLSFSTSNYNLPYQYVDGGSASDVTTSTFNFSSAFQNTNGVISGFNMVLDVSAGGGYTMDSNVLFTLDQSELTRDATNSYIQLQNLQDLSHILTIVNGTTTLSSATGSSNPNYITIADEYETLDSNFNGIDGLINIIVDDTNNRVYYPESAGQIDGSGSNVTNNYGTKSTLTDSVVVDYPYDATPSIADFSNGVLLVTEDVNFYVEILAPTTVYATESDFLNEDLSRNLAYNSNTVLVLASPDMPTSGAIVQTDFDLSSNLTVGENQIYIISIENQSILTQDSPLLDANDDPVVGTSATVSMTNIDLSNNASPYSDFEVRLNTKTIGDLSNILQLTNGWSIVGSENTYLQGTALQTGVINDDYLFMTTDPARPIDMSYVFQIANPTCASIQAIKRRVQISFFDLSYSKISGDELSYNNTETVFYLDDQDITLNNKLIVDVSMAICNNISSTNPSYPVSSYTFQKHTQTITYTASFLSKFQFYTNVSFQTPEITEQAVYYKIFKNGVEQPSYLLKWFTDGCNSGNLLSNVYVSLVGEPIYTEFTYSQHACSILTATIWGKDNTNEFVPLPTDPIDIDPFFRQNGVVVNLLDGEPGSNGTASISVQFPSDVPVESSSYKIELSTGLGENQALTSKRYIYTVGGTELDAYTNNGFIYNKFYGTLMLNQPLLTTIVDRVDGMTIVTIKDDADNVLAVVEHPDTYIYNYNIISGLAPLARVDYTVGLDPTVSSRVLAFDGSITILDGVNYYFNTSSAVVGANETFALVTDSFNLKHVDDNGYSYNTYSTTQKFDCCNIQVKLDCSADANSNYARGVTFSQLRGYHNVDGGDAITIDRTVTTATFNLSVDANDNTATEFISNVYNGLSYQLYNVEFDGTDYSLGLILDFDKSMLTSSDPTSYQIYVTVANYALYVNGSQVATDYLTQNTNLLSPYFNGLQPASIQSASDYSLTLTYTVPDLVINKSQENSYFGNPLDVEDWINHADVSFNTLLDGYLVIPGFQIQQYSLSNVFYESHTSYFVLSPPAVTVYGIKDFTNGDAITSLPVYTSGVPLASFHINHDVNYYSINPYWLLYTVINFYEDTVKPYSDYKTIRNNSNEHKYFRLEGNYATIKLYLNGTDSNGSNSPAVVDANTSPIDTLFTREILSDLSNSSPFPGNNVNVIDDSYINTVYYKQFLPSANQYNATANIVFTLGNYFTPQSTTYLRLAVNTGSSTSFYQSNLVYDASGLSGTYYIVIDRFDTDAVINYNQLLQGGTVNELVFPISTHSTKQFAINNEEIIDENGNLSSISDIITTINYSDIDNASWITDDAFQLQYLGLTLSGITQQGITNLNNVLTYSSAASLDSKALYINLPDIIKVQNILGNTIYRVTNSGNVHAPRVTTSNVSLFVNPAVGPTTDNIVGAMDIQSIFTQNSLLNNENFNIV
jgi:hypothetical protein